MSRKKKGGLWEFLSASGVLDSNDDILIRNTKAAYWKEYRTAWIKRKRKECRKFIVYLSKDEAEFVGNKALRHKRSVTAFIKESCLCYLTNRYLVPDVLFVNSVREQLVMINAGVQQLLQQSVVGYKDFRAIHEKMLVLERLCLQELLEPLLLEARIEEEVRNDTEYKKKLLKLIENM